MYNNMNNYNGRKATSLLLPLVLCIFLFYVGIYLWKRRWLYYYAWKAPGPFAWPIVGNALWFLTSSDDILEGFKFLLKKFQKPFRLWIGHRLYFVVTDPGDIQIVTKRCLDKDQVYKILKLGIGEGLVSANLDIWKTHRKVIAPTFNRKILDGFLEIYEKKAQLLGSELERMSKNGIFDAHSIIHRFTLDIISETVFDTKIHAYADDFEHVRHMERVMEILFIRLLHVWLHPDFMWKFSPLKKEVEEILSRSKKYTAQLISERRKWYQESQRNTLPETRPKCFVDHLIQRAEEDTNWSDEEIQDEVITMATAGSDTNAIVLGFALLILGIYPKLQTKIHKELDLIFKCSERNITKDDIQAMMYLERVIKETMRMYPPAPIIFRAIHEDIELSSLVLPKGSSCIITPVGTHSDPVLWPDPEKFNPDRFLPEKVENRHPCAYIPFSYGPRNCVGMTYAMMSLKVVLATILRRYKIYTEYKTMSEIKVKTTIISRSAEGIRIRLKPRFKNCLERQKVEVVSKSF